MTVVRGNEPTEREARDRLDHLVNGVYSPEKTGHEWEAAATDVAWVAVVARFPTIAAELLRVRGVRGYAQPIGRLIYAVNIAQQPPSGADPCYAVEQLLRYKTKPDGSLGAVESNSFNVSIILRHDPRWEGRLGFAEFAQVPTWNGAPIKQPMGPALCCFTGEHYGFEVNHHSAAALIDAAALANPYHPVRDYLSSLEWDGQPRAHGWLTSHAGAPNKTIVQAYAKRWLISAVARIFNPGCKVDTCLVLQGAQGAKKSTLLRVMAGEEWFSDTPIDVGSKDAMAALHGVWIYEFAEMEAVKRGKAATATKAFLTSPTDKYRASYARHVTAHPRSCVIAGTTNDAAALPADDTGSRRYWPVEITRVDVEALKLDRDQLWAEAVELYRSGEQWWLTDDEERRRIKSESIFVEQDAWLESVQNYLEGRVQVTVPGIWVDGMAMKAGQMTQTSHRRIYRIMGDLGWVKAKRQGRHVWIEPE